MLTANRGLCGGYNASVLRLAYARWAELRPEVPEMRLEVSGKRGISAFRFRKITPGRPIPSSKTGPLSTRSTCWPIAIWTNMPAGQLDRLDVAYTRFEIARPAGGRGGNAVADERVGRPRGRGDNGNGQPQYEFLPSAASILEEVVPTSLQGQAFQVFPRCGRERADRPDGGHEGRHRKRRRR